MKEQDPCTILVVDDEPHLVQVLQAALGLVDLP